MKKLFICLLIISIIGSLPVFAITEESEDSIETARIIKNADHDKDLNIKERKNPKKKGKKKITVPPREINPETGEITKEDIILELDEN